MSLNVNMSKSDQIGAQLLSIKNFLNQINTTDYELDFSRYTFSPPLLSIFFAAFLEGKPSYRILNLSDISYLKHIYFPNGIQPDKINNWQDIIDLYKNKSYLPLINFPTSKTNEISLLRNNIISITCRMIKDIVNLPNNYYEALSYFISELTDNIVGHSKANRGWLSFQYYESKKYLDLCIADSGIGLLQSYKEYSGSIDFSNISDDIDALDNVIKGFSTKYDKERGYGVHTSREMLIKGLKGTFVYFSGSALLYNYELLDFKCYYQGTIALLRIPLTKFDDEFNIFKFVE